MISVILVTTVVALPVVAIAAWQVIHRRSPYVRRWRRSSFKRHTAGPLSVLDGGVPAIDSGDTVVVLHGLGATGDYFGDLYDGLSGRRRVLIPDLLGFGASLDESREHFGLDAHLRALESSLESCDIDDSRLTLVAHSMGDAVALSFAQAHPARVDRVVLWGPPVHRSESEARDAAGSFGALSRLFLLDNDLARRLCRWNCAHRSLSGRLMAIAAPRWPTEVSTKASQHTWSAYSESLVALALDVDWPVLLADRPRVTVLRGDQDPTGDADYLRELLPASQLIVVPGGGHHLPLTHPELLYDLLDGRSE